MRRLRNYFSALRKKWAMTPEQAELFATIKFLCC
mgnify:CR=1 FL=1|jgi:hypothetical protein